MPSIKTLAESETLETITPSEYLELYPEQRELDTLFPGVVVQHQL